MKKIILFCSEVLLANANEPKTFITQTVKTLIGFITIAFVVAITNTLVDKLWIVYSLLVVSIFPTMIFVNWACSNYTSITARFFRKINRNSLLTLDFFENDNIQYGEKWFFTTDKNAIIGLFGTYFWCLSTIPIVYYRFSGSPVELRESMKRFLDNPEWTANERKVDKLLMLFLSTLPVSIILTIMIIVAIILWLNHFSI